MMTKIVLVLSLVIGSQSLAQRKPASKPEVERKSRIFGEIKNAYIKDDDLTLRILIKTLAGMGMTKTEWAYVRRVLVNRPTIGFDLLFKWDSVRPGKINPKSREGKIVNLVANADVAMMQENFDKAFRYYQLVAKFVRREVLSGKKDNYYLYWHSVHAMARALYGAGRYKEAVQVYNWIGRDYFRYRQTLFEKMWAGFRADRLDIALGAIASQQSSYFSNYLEPETYLVQAYIFKKLCREDELAKVRELIRSVRNKWDPKKGQMTMQDWAKSDVEYLSLYNLTQVKFKEDDPYGKRKKLEQSRITDLLEKRFHSERARLYKQMDMVLAFSNLSVAMDNTRVNSDVVPNRSQLLKANREFWPSDSAEDWVDELGRHLYIGESQCEKKQ